MLLRGALRHWLLVGLHRIHASHLLIWGSTCASLPQKMTYDKLEATKSIAWRDKINQGYFLLARRSFGVTCVVGTTTNLQPFCSKMQNSISGRASPGTDASEEQSFEVVIVMQCTLFCQFTYLRHSRLIIRLICRRILLLIVPRTRGHLLIVVHLSLYIPN